MRFKTTMPYSFRRGTPAARRYPGLLEQRATAQIGQNAYPNRAPTFVKPLSWAQERASERCSTVATRLHCPESLTPTDPASRKTGEQPMAGRVGEGTSAWDFPS